MSSRGAKSFPFYDFVFLLCCGRKTDAIQKRAAYFGCIAALDGSSEVLAPVERPFSAWPASSAPPRSSRGRSGVAAMRRSFANSSPGGGRARRRTRRRRRSEDGNRRGRQTGVRLPIKVRGSCLSMSALPVPGILTGTWVHPGGAGRRLRLTTAPGTSKHLSALDEVVDSAFDLWNKTQSACACPDATYPCRTLQFPNFASSRSGIGPRRGRKGSGCARHYVPSS